MPLQSPHLQRPEDRVDSVVFVKIASTAVVTHLASGTLQNIVNAVSNAVVYGHALNIYRTKSTAPRQCRVARVVGFSRRHKTGTREAPSDFVRRSPTGARLSSTEPATGL